MGISLALGLLLVPPLAAQLPDFGGWNDLQRASGTSSLGEFGSDCLAGADLNGDGIADYVGAEPFADLGSMPAVGRIAAFSGADGAPLWQVFGAQPSDAIGQSLGPIADVNGDAVPELLVCSTAARRNHPDRQGMVMILSGATGVTIDAVYGPDGLSDFGSAAVGLDDLDGDGVPEFLVTQSNHLLFQPTPGRAILFNGRTRLAIATYQDDAYPSRRFGSSAVLLDDVDGDGYRDVAIAYEGVGAVDIVSAAQWKLIRRITPSRPSAFSGTNVRTPLRVLDDLDADGVRDLLIGCPNGTWHGNLDRGLVWAVSVGDGSVIDVVGVEAGDNAFGASLAVLSDLNNDGIDDFAVGIPDAANGGKVRLYSGATRQVLVELHGKGDGRFGSSLASAGDLNYDHLGELVIGDTLTRLGGARWPGSVSVWGYRRQFDLRESGISRSLGGDLHFVLDFPSYSVGQPYQILASASGTGPGAVGGVEVQLTVDNLFHRFLAGPVPGFPGSRGLLGPRGNRAVVWPIPPGVIPSSLPGPIWFATVARGSQTGEIFSSAAQTLLLLL